MNGKKTPCACGVKLLKGGLVLMRVMKLSGYALMALLSNGLYSQ